MRFIYIVILGLIIFNSMLVFMGGIFAIQGEEPTIAADAVNISSDTSFNDYNLISSNNIWSLNKSSIGIMGISVGLGAIFAWIFKSPIPIGAALLAGFIGTLYSQAAGVIYSILPRDNWILAGIITVVGICLAILVGFTIVEWFAQQSGAE